MTAHVADFGIAKLLYGDDNSAVSVSMPGTIGYMAPGTPSHTSLVFYHAKLLIHVLLQLILLLVNIFFTRVRFQWKSIKKE